MRDDEQYRLFADEEALRLQQVMDVVVGVLSKHEQPSAWDLVNIIEFELGWKARWYVKAAFNELKSPLRHSTKAWRGYLDSLTESGDLEAVLRGVDAPKKEIVSSIDLLLRHSKVYQYSEQFRD
jgi:hypothetical protein